MDIVIRATVIYFGVLLLVRVMGRRELAQLTPFELVVLIVIGDLIQQGVTHNDFSLTGALLAVCTFAFWGAVLGWASYLSRRAERFLDGEPRVVVQDGKILADNLRRDRLTEAEILSEMRLSGIGRLEQVAWAIMEPKGKLSFIGRDADAQRPRAADEERV